MIEDGGVHTAEDGKTPPPMRYSSLPGVVTRPEVRALYARRLRDDAVRVLLSWQAAPGADLYQVEMAEGDNPDDPDLSWTRTADTTATHHVISLLFAARTMVRVRAMGLASGPWIAATLGDLIPEMWNTNATSMWTLDVNSMWSA